MFKLHYMFLFTKGYTPPFPSPYPLPHPPISEGFCTNFKRQQVSQHIIYKLYQHKFSSLNPLTIYLYNTSKWNAYCTLTPTEHNRYSEVLKIDLTRKEPALSFNKCIYMIKYRLSVTTRLVQWYSSIFVGQVTAY